MRHSLESVQRCGQLEKRLSCSPFNPLATLLMVVLDHRWVLSCRTPMTYDPALYEMNPTPAVSVPEARLKLTAGDHLIGNNFSQEASSFSTSQCLCTSIFSHSSGTSYTTRLASKSGFGTADGLPSESTSGYPWLFGHGNPMPEYSAGGMQHVIPKNKTTGCPTTIKTTVDDS